MRKLPHTAAEDLLELVMRRYERASTLLTSNRPVDDWGKLLGDTAAVTALLDRLLHHAHVLKCGPRSWRTKVHTDLRPEGRKYDAAPTPVEAARAVDGPERRPPRVGKRSRVFHKLPPAIMSRDIRTEGSGAPACVPPPI